MSLLLHLTVVAVTTSFVLGLLCTSSAAFSVPRFHFAQRGGGGGGGALVHHRTTQVKQAASSSSPSSPSAEEEVQLDERLLDIGRKLKLEIFDLDENVYGFVSRDQRYGLEVVKTNVSIAAAAADGAIGLVLTEVAASAADDRGLVLVRTVAGQAALAEPAIHVGDVITGAWAGHGHDNHLHEQTTGLNYDMTVDCLSRVKEAALKSDGVLTLQLNRLIKRAPIRVEVDDGSGRIQVIEALAGENLRRLLLRKGIKLYDRQTKRFDMPYASGDCAGEGLCGTCLVAVQTAGDANNYSLNEMDGTERLITKGRPASWRASCRTVVGADNRPATVRVSIHPQSRFADELNPGVRSLGAD